MGNANYLMPFDDWFCISIGGGRRLPLEDKVFGMADQRRGIESHEKRETTGGMEKVGKWGVGTR